MTLYHVTPWATWVKQIKKHGLKPRTKKRGIYAEPGGDRIYFFGDRDTADDGLTNWLIDEFPDVRYFAVLSVQIPDGLVEVHDDPEVAGAYYITEPLPKEAVIYVEKVDAGEE